MEQVILDPGFDVNVLPKQTWEIMGRPMLQGYLVHLSMENQQKIIPMGRIYGVSIDIEAVSTMAHFEVIEIFDDSNPYRVLLGIEWAINMNRLINLKKRMMFF